MDQKGITLSEVLLILCIVVIVAGFLYGIALREQDKKIIQFELVFEIDLRPHLIGYRTIDPKMKNAIREEVTKQLTELWREYYEVRSERREIERKSPREFGGAAKQLRKLRELDSVMAKKWGPYIKARKLAEWWKISIDLPKNARSFRPAFLFHQMSIE